MPRGRSYGLNMLRPGAFCLTATVGLGFIAKNSSAVEAALRIVRPMRDDSFTSGDVVPVEWVYTGNSSHFDIRLLFAGAEVKGEICEMGVCFDNDGIYEVTLPLGLFEGSLYSFRVEDMSDRRVFGLSEEFTILPSAESMGEDASQGLLVFFFIAALGVLGIVLFFLCTCYFARHARRRKEGLGEAEGDDAPDPPPPSVVTAEDPPQGGVEEGGGDRKRLWKSLSGTSLRIPAQEQQCFTPRGRGRPLSRALSLVEMGVYSPGEDDDSTHIFNNPMLPPGRVRAGARARAGAGAGARVGARMGPGIVLDDFSSFAGNDGRGGAFPGMAAVAALAQAAAADAEAEERLAISSTSHPSSTIDAGGGSWARVQNSGVGRSLGGGGLQAYSAGSRGLRRHSWRGSYQSWRGGSDGEEKQQDTTGGMPLERGDDRRALSAA
ncbi:unnamed protein product, partial [Discosporangium mesarthrocarpum]